MGKTDVADEYIYRHSGKKTWRDSTKEPCNTKIKLPGHRAITHYNYNKSEDEGNDSNKSEEERNNSNKSKKEEKEDPKSRNTRHKSHSRTPSTTPSNAVATLLYI